VFLLDAYQGTFGSSARKVKPGIPDLKAFFTTIWLVFAPAAFSATPANPETIDEVFVNAKRRPASLVEISSAISVIQRDSVLQQTLVTDALAANTGVFLQQTTPGQGAAVVRGLKGSAVLHLVDGMRLNNAIFRSAPTQYLALVPPAAIQRIEIIRGTPASLYGSDAVGGVVQVVTRVPKFETSETKVRGDVLLGFDTADLGKTVRATLDVGNRQLAMSVNAGYHTSGNRRTGSGERIGPSGYNSRSARLLLIGAPNTATSWLLDLHYLEQPETPRIDELVAGFGQTEPSSSEYFFAPNQRLFAHARLSFDSGAPELDWNLDFAWQRIVDDRITRDLDAPVRLLESNRSDLYAVSLTAARDGDLTGWIVGAELDYDRVRSARTEELLFDGSHQLVTPRFPDGSTLRQAGLYGNIDYRLDERHTVSAGLRFSSIEVDLPATAVSQGATVSADDVSGDLGWIYDLTATMQLIANAGFGFRAPNVFDIGTLGNRPGNRFNIPNTDLDSERVVQGDFGLRYQGGKWQAEFVVYALQYSDRITSVLTGDVTADGRDVVQSVNASRTSIHGVEAGFDARLSEALTASVNLNYTRGQQRTSGGSDEPADRIPPLNGRLRLEYDNGGSWQYEGWVNFAEHQHRLSARDTRDVRIDPAGTAGWGSVGARVSRDTGGDWLFSIELDNLLDKTYRNHGSGIDAAGRSLALIVRRLWR
jgi:outer membrane receptor protein involved in Fe transport